MERYNLRIKPSAVKEIEGISTKKDRQKIVRRIQSLVDNPRPPGCEKLTHQDRYRVRQGRYRIIYSIDDHPGNIIIVKVSHRSDV